MRISKRAQIPPSATLAISAKAKSMKASGEDVIILATGEPDFPSPDEAKKAGLKAIENNFTYYTLASGTAELRQAVAEWTNNNFGSAYQASNVLITPGAKYALFLAFFTLLEENDEVIIPAPYWVSYPQQVRLCGAKPVIIETTEKNAFIPQPDEIKKLITPKTKIILLNSPTNPTGAIFPKEVMEEIWKIAVEKNIFVLSDEIYSHIYFEEKPASLAGKENVLIVNGVSKTFSMTGWRIGWLIGPEEIVKAASSVQSQTTSNPTSISQKAALGALNTPKKTIEERRLEFKRRRDYFYQALCEIPGFKPFKPKGTFYMWINVTEAMKKAGKQNDIEFADYLLENLKIACVPGTGFGAPGWVRMSFATSIENLQKAVKRLKEAFR